MMYARKAPAKRRSGMPIPSVTPIPTRSVAACESARIDSDRESVVEVGLEVKVGAGVSRDNEYVVWEGRVAPLRGI